MTIYESLMQFAAGKNHVVVETDGSGYTITFDGGKTTECTPETCFRCGLEALAKQVCAEADLKLSHLVDEVLRERMEVPTLCVLIESDIIGGPQ